MPRTALIVHDDESTLESVSSLLTLRGYKVLAARSPLRAVDLFAEQELSVILLGLTAIEDREIEAVSIFRRRCPEAAILLLFPERLRERAAEALTHGADAYLPEPFYPRELLALALPRDVARVPPHAVLAQTAHPQTPQPEALPSRTAQHPPAQPQTTPPQTSQPSTARPRTVRPQTARPAPPRPVADPAAHQPAASPPVAAASPVQPMAASPVRPATSSAAPTPPTPPPSHAAPPRDGLHPAPAALAEPLPLGEHASRSDLAALAAHVAHEIRNPLQVLELLLSHAETSGEVDLTGVRLELDRIGAVVRSLTRTSVDQGGDEDLVDVDGLVRDVFESSPDPIDMGDEVGFLIETRPVSALVSGSPELLRTALELLRERAAGLSSPGGSVTVRVILDRRTVAGRGTTGGEAVRIDVEDGGVAPDDHTLARMFSQTEEADASDPATPFELAAFAEIVRSHGGRTEAHRGPRGGTLIRACLPLQSRAPAVHGPADLALDRSQSGRGGDADAQRRRVLGRDPRPTQPKPEKPSSGGLRAG